MDMHSTLQTAGVADVAVVTEDGSPHGPKSFLLWNPPLSNSPSAHREAAADALAPPRLPQMSHTEGRTRAGSVKWAAHLLSNPLSPTPELAIP